MLEVCSPCCISVAHHCRCVDGRCSHQDRGQHRHSSSHYHYRGGVSRGQRGGAGGHVGRGARQIPAHRRGAAETVLYLPYPVYPLHPYLCPHVVLDVLYLLIQDINMGEDLRTLHEGEGRKAQGQRAGATELRSFGEIHTGRSGSVGCVLDMYYILYTLKCMLSVYIYVYIYV